MVAVTGSGNFYDEVLREMLFALGAALFVAPPRRKTRPTKASERRRKQAKRRRGEIKRGRRPPATDTDG